MSVTPNLCYDETEPRSIHSPDSSKGRVKVSQTCLILCDPMDCSPPDSSVHGILQANILEWVAIFFSRESFQPRDPA